MIDVMRWEEVMYRNYAVDENKRTFFKLKILMRDIIT